MVLYFLFLDIIQWPMTKPGVFEPVNLSDGLGLCFSVRFWRLSQQDVRLKNSQRNSVLTVRLKAIRATGEQDNYKQFLVACLHPDLNY
jgi:hypothetical protein